MKMKYSKMPRAAGSIRRAGTFVLAGAMLPLVLGLGAAWAQQPAAAPAAASAVATAPESEAINPAAIEALKSMGAYLHTLKSFSVRSESTTDEVLASGQKVQFANTVDIRSRLPNRVRVDVSSDRKSREIYYDGKTVTQFAPRLKYYATVPAPPTVRETLKAAATKYDLDVPLADLFYWGTDQSGIDAIKSAIYVGPSRVAGVEVDHYAFRQPGVDWQVWIETGKAPLVRKLVITTLDEPSQPQYTAVLHWDLKTPLNDKAFTFVPPKGAMKIELATAPAAK
jgi:hypothetical protein